MTTFTQVARDVARKSVALHTVDVALESLGTKAALRVAELDTEHKLLMIGQFVRALRNVGVADAHRIEQDLFGVLGAAPTSRRTVLIKDAISLITVRNHIHQLATSIGMPWSASMQVQSAVSDVARFVSTNGGGRLETEARPDARIHVDVWTNWPLGYVSIRGAAPAWLVGVAKVADDFRAQPEGPGTHLAMRIAAPESLVA